MQQESTVTIVKVKGIGAGKDSMTTIPVHTYEEMLKEAKKEKASLSSKEILNFKVLRYSDESKNTNQSEKIVKKLNEETPVVEEAPVKSEKEIEEEALAELEESEVKNETDNKK